MVSIAAHGSDWLKAGIWHFSSTLKLEDETILFPVSSVPVWDFPLVIGPYTHLPSIYSSTRVNISTVPLKRRNLAKYTPNAPTFSSSAHWNRGCIKD